MIDYIFHGPPQGGVSGPAVAVDKTTGQLYFSHPSMAGWQPMGTVIALIKDAPDWTGIFLRNETGRNWANAIVAWKNDGSQTELHSTTNGTIYLTSNSSGGNSSNLRLDGTKYILAGNGYGQLRAAVGHQVAIQAYNTDPVTAEMQNSMVAFSVDEAANKLKFTVKYSNGVVKTGTVDLV